MKIFYGGMYIGTIEANEYTVRELESAGFTVVIDQYRGGNPNNI